MSRLSRFKKAPSLRLPKKIPLPITQDEDSDDDDFITRRKPIKYKDTPKSEEKSPKTERESASQLLSPLEASTSEYFRQPTNDVSPKNEPLSRKVYEKKVTPELSNDIEEKSTDAPRNKGKTKAKAKQIKETTSSSASPEVPPPVVQEENNDNEDGEGKIVCPFCWKKLSDKLTGTTHVKACAKNVPIPQIIEAMQLQEKQMQEWEKLGLAFPGFAAGNTNNNGKKTKNASGTGATRTRTGGGSRRKRTTPVTTGDPEFELAVALSMSLHEELESRQSKENQFIIENGLEKEIELVEVKPTVPKDSQKQASSRQFSEVPPVVAASTVPPVSRRRGKKVQLNELPLYTVNDDKKKAIICERVSKILDETEKDQDQGFYIRNKIPSNSIGVPKRLMQFQNKENPLWTKAQATLDVPNESFSVLELPDPSQKLEMTYPGTDESPDELHSTDNSFVETDNKEIPTIENESVAKIPVAVQPVVKKKDKSAVKLPVSNARKVSISSTSSAGSSIASQSLQAIQKLPRVTQDILKLLMDKKDCDMTLYGREERPIKCHSFMLLARCPGLLSDVIEEKHGKRVIPLTNYSHKTIKAYLWYVYTGEIDENYGEDLLEELKDLTSTYGMSFDSEPKVKTTSEATPPSCCSVEVQTDIVITEDSSTMTMTGNDEGCSAETGFDSCDEYKASQELFTTYMEEEPQIDLQERKCKSPVKETFQLADMIENKSDHEDDDDEDAACSDVDLFEEIENEMNKALQLRQSVPNCTAGTGTTIPVTSHCASPEPEHIDVLKPVEGSSSEESFWKELKSPCSSLDNGQRKSSSDKKRLRSDSPLVDHSNQLYTGTQAAEMLDVHYSGGDVQQYMTKAIKKQKLDCSDFKQANEDCEMEVDSLNAEGDSVNKWCDDNDDDDALFNFSYNVNPQHQSGLVTPKSNLVKSRRSVSTPNLSIIEPDHKLNDSPFYNNQQDLDNEVDPFWGACDDSVFANIPDEMLVKVKTPKIRNVNGTNRCPKSTTAPASCASQKGSTPLSHTRRRLSPRNLSRFEDEESLSTTTTTRRGNKTGRGNGNGRAKQPPKIKLPRNLKSTKNASQFECNSHSNDSSQSQQDTIKSQPQPPHPLAESTNSSNSKSPMLNYSLIDTPILKQELKKYGIKPLPRSKAKVLLRHIYKETHK